MNVKKCINYRLLKHNLYSYDYKLINNKPYNKRKYSVLFANYIWHETKNIDLVTKILLKYSKQRIFIAIETLLNFLIPEYEKEYSLNFNTSEKYRILIFEKSPRYCPNCNCTIVTNNKYCSVKCANKHKSTNETYLENLKNAQINYYKNVDKDDLRNRHDKIKTTINENNSLLTSEEKSIKYSNKAIDYTAFDNWNNRLYDVEFLFDKEYFYGNKYLPVKCRTCDHKWEMTKSTTMSRISCMKCNPQQKGKTQAEIADFISVYYKYNDKSFLENNKEIDILCVDDKLAIEFDGLLPHSFGDSRVSFYNNRCVYPEYHLRKTEECERNDFTLFHIFENEWKDEIKQQIWKSMINNKLGLSNKIYARECTIKEIEYSISSNFLEVNHLQGDCKSDIKLGLFYTGGLVAVMTIRKHNKYQWEIVRFANKINSTVVGGLSKLLNYFELKYKPNSLLSYVNRRLGDGQVYNRLGFDFEGNTEPNYFYFRENENILYPSEKFQKHKLKNVLENYDKDKTELINMFDNRYRIIYDCGDKMYVKYYTEKEKIKKDKNASL